MNRKDIYSGVGSVDEDILERSERNRSKRKRSFPRWVGAVAAALAVVLAGGILLNRGVLSGGPFAIRTCAINEAEYPKMPSYRNRGGHSMDTRLPKGCADKLRPFCAAALRQFLSDAETENRLCSPLNIYMALGMLAELTDGNSRQQILELLGSGSVEALRGQANKIWRTHYQDDGATSCVLASSLWLNDHVDFVPSTMQTLAQSYYASSYRGEMGSEKLNRALQSWLGKQTGGLLKEQTKNIKLSPYTVLTLATTVLFRAKWIDEFSSDKTSPAVFHAPSGELTCDFMHGERETGYFWGERFGAVFLSFRNSSQSLWLLLPDEGVSAEELLRDDETMEFLSAGRDWKNQKYMRVRLSLPKFDVSSQTELDEGLRALGVTDVFDGAVSDFTPMTTDMGGIFVSGARHGVRAAIDEEGMTAAAYTVIPLCEAAAPPEDVIDFVLDRPFMFAVTDGDGLPLLAGIVNEP